MSNHLTIPLSVSAPTRQALSKAMADVQAREGGKVAVINILFAQGEWICWYLPIRTSGMAL